MPETVLNPSTTRDVQPSTPTEQVSANGTPKGMRTPLPSSILDSIRAKATQNLPASEVAPTTTPAPAPPSKDEPPKAAASPSKEATPLPTTAKAADTTPAVKPAPAEAKVDGDKPAKKDGIAAVREALERAEARAREVESNYHSTAKEKAEAFAKLAEVEKKAQSLEEKFAKEYEPQIKRLTEKEKRLQEVEEQLRIRDYTATPEWHDTIEKPIAATHERIGRILKQVAVTDPSTGQQRQATVEDFTRIAQIPFLNAREAAAKQMFGEGFVASELTRLSGELETQLENRKQALGQAHIKSQEYFKKAQEEQMANQARLTQVVRENVKKHLIQPAEDDPEEVRAMQDGEAFADDLDRAAQSGNYEVWAPKLAQARADLLNKRILETRFKRVEAENAALKAELKRYQSNEPEVGGSGKGVPPPEGSQMGGPLPKSDLHQHLMSRARELARGRV